MIRLKKNIKHLLFTVYKVGFLIVGKILPNNTNLIVFESFLDKQYIDIPRAIYEYVCKNYLTYKFIWSIDKESISKFKTLDVKYSKHFSLKWLYLMNRAKYWVSNSRMPLWIPKPQNTIYLQTWHGTPLKKLAADMDQVLMPGTDT